jgi:agmatine deiminase
MPRVPRPPNGFRMPAEWEPHHSTWIAWPHNRKDWPGKFNPIAWVYGEIVRHLHDGERVCILVQDDRLRSRARNLLVRAGVNLDQVDFFPFATDRVWSRDFGPIFIKREVAGQSELAITNWKFNGWGKYSNWRRDNAIPAKIALALKLKQFEPQWEVERTLHRVVLEGGSIDVNGKGTLLTTEECLLSPIQARNPKLNREDLEGVFAEYLGIRKVLWLQNGIAGDDTHGHVDDLARFVNPTTVVVAQETDANDANYQPLRKNLELLKSMTDQDGNPLEIVPLPMPRPLWLQGQRLPASYANFYIGNAAVLVPTFNDPHDREALSILARLFPDREVIGIHSVDLVWGLGTLHCLSQQQPR